MYQSSYNSDKFILQEIMSEIVNDFYRKKYNINLFSQKRIFMQLMFFFLSRHDIKITKVIQLRISSVKMDSFFYIFYYLCMKNTAAEWFNTTNDL